MRGHHAGFGGGLGECEFVVRQVHVRAAVDVVPDAHAVGCAPCLQSDGRARVLKHGVSKQDRVASASRAEQQPVNRVGVPRLGSVHQAGWSLGGGGRVCGCVGGMERGVLCELVADVATASGHGNALAGCGESYRSDAKPAWGYKQRRRTRNG